MFCPLLTPSHPSQSWELFPESLKAWFMASETPGKRIPRSLSSMEWGLLVYHGSDSLHGEITVLEQHNLNVTGLGPTSGPRHLGSVPLPFLDTDLDGLVGVQGIGQSGQGWILLSLPLNY